MAFFDGDFFDGAFFDAGPPTPPPPPSFDVYRNGTLREVLWSRAQLLSISLAIVAYDGTIGTGSVTLPGAPEDDDGWQIGDRISFIDPDAATVLYTGYLMRPQIERNPDAPTELQTAWQLMDLNRLFIGRRISEVTQGYFWLAGVSNYFDDAVSADPPTVDVTTWVNTDLFDNFPTDPAISYTSDGWTDVIRDIIGYSGYTVYLGLTDTENSLQLHVHELGAVNPAGIAISDAATEAADTFAPGNPVRTMETADLKDGITGRNGVEESVVANANGYNQGGIDWEAFVDYQVDKPSLDFIVDNVRVNSINPKPTLGFTIYDLTGAQVKVARAGMLIGITSDVLRPAGMGNERIGHLTLNVSRDEAGNPRPGWWDMAIESGYPYRGPTAVSGLVAQGLQGTALGAFSSYRQWVRTEVGEDNPGIAVGEFETARAQLLDKDDIATPVANVGITFTVVSNDYDDLHPDYSVFPTGSFTDESGAAYVTVEHFQDTFPLLPHRVKAEPT